MYTDNVKWYMNYDLTIQLINHFSKISVISRVFQL